MTRQYPRITIITPSFNQSQYIEQTIQSVLSQNYPSFEHIVVDGGSTDGTVEILKSYPHIRWVSEKDEGQADALNKGLAMATGDVVGWINSDDYYEKDVFQNVAKEFEDDRVQWIIGNIIDFYDDGSRPERLNKSPLITYERLLTDPHIVRQAATFFRKAILIEVGGWNEDYFMVMDYDLWLRLARKSPPKMIDKYWARFRYHDSQKTGLENSFRQMDEIYRLMIAHNVPFLKRALWRSKRCIELKWRSAKICIKRNLIHFGLIDKRYENLPFLKQQKYRE